MCLKLKEAAQTPEMRTVIRYVMKMSAQNRQEHNNVQSRAEHDYFSLTEFSVPAPSMHRIRTRASWTPRTAAKSPRTPSSYSCGSTTTLDTLIGNTELPTIMTYGYERCESNLIINHKGLSIWLPTRISRIATTSNGRRPWRRHWRDRSNWASRRICFACMNLWQ